MTIKSKLFLTLLIFFIFILSIQITQVYKKTNSLSTCKIQIVFLNDATSLACDNQINFPFKLIATTLDGYPIANQKFTITESSNFGTITLTHPYTNKNGELLGYYSPQNQFLSSPKKIQLLAKPKSFFTKENAQASPSLTLKPNPIIMIHGYQETFSSFSTIMDYFTSNNSNTFLFKYPYDKGVSESSKAFAHYIEQKKAAIKNSGLYFEKFDIISYSLGGVIARYYTSHPDYLENQTVRKLAFLSVPHNGTEVANIGKTFFNNTSIQDLSTSSELFYSIFSNHMNHGLNPSIPTLNLLGKNDEVVTEFSASLSFFGIQTEIYDLGNPSLFYDKVINKKYPEAFIHTSIINNQNIFSRVLCFFENDT